MTKKLPASTLLTLAIFGCGVAAACVQFHLPPAPSPPAKYRKKLTDAELAVQLDAAAVAADEAAALAAADAAAAVDAAALAGADAAEAPAGPRALGKSEKESTGKTRMDTNTPPPIPSGPPIATDILLNRILTLVDGLRSPNDVTRAQVERMMEVKLTPGEVENWWVYTGSTDAGWEYSVFVEDNRKEDLPKISIGFSSGESESTDSVVCSYELENLSKRLTALGYDRLPGWGQPRAHLGFDRQAEDSRFGSSIHVFKYIWKKRTEDSGPVYCVENMNISAGVRADGE